MGVLSVYRHEMKYQISWSDALTLQEKLDKLLARDHYSENGPYMVRSLYFDTVNNLDYSTKLAGTEIRKKIRLRIYSPDDQMCKLEMKQKNGDRQHKVSLLISRADAQRLVDGQYNVLLDYAGDTEAALQLYTTMMLGCYRPVALIEYLRIAYVYGTYNTRISFDIQVRTSESCFDLFHREPNYIPVSYEQVILEVKYNQRLMGFISQTLKPYLLNQVSVSKYCIGRKIHSDFND